ncbi:SDR family NAD(P)-dependent oxidoreductase [Nocardioides sp. zg-536]|uniref:SDR family NAD(P)-dependent oxidoreductase n=1 Tax=Nocardioides faecalis TaxID=2803858 RepID=A0A938Y8C0_9ACTN|nr:SDR family NAD(P)-dependent oxidoreductase [Nocardioides faecalis]MBM9459094.1 SDR family NAD(P)-dependent oxidoreductase [Nocardioides faecalis]QVI57353.1 SDR family NAD(P)-dependent oxidoreductase [Nocardioides faecalis]
MRPWTKVPPQAGRRFVITGSNGGLGLETARILGSRGAEIVMACRSVEKAEAAARTVPGHDKGRVTVRRVDVSDLASVRAFVAEEQAEGRGIDVLINNAGVLGVPHSVSAEGVEMHFATNYLGHFALTLGLLPQLRDRVVMLSSREHRSGRIDLDDLGWERRPYRPFAAYGASKLADLLFMRELDRRLRATGSPVRSVGAHPGATATSITSGSGHPLITWIGHHGHRLVGMPAWRGALCTVYAAVADIPGGTYIGPHGRTELWGWPAPARMSPKVEDTALAAALWQRSVELTGVDLEEPGAGQPGAGQPGGGQPGA